MGDRFNYPTSLKAYGFEIIGNDIEGVEHMLKEFDPGPPIGIKGTFRELIVKLGGDNVEDILQLIDRNIALHMKQSTVTKPKVEAPVGDSVGNKSAGLGMRRESLDGSREPLIKQLRSTASSASERRHKYASEAILICAFVFLWLGRYLIRRTDASLS